LLHRQPEVEHPPLEVLPALALERLENAGHGCGGRDEEAPIYALDPAVADRPGAVVDFFDGPSSDSFP
jgi:hypothetical protein